MMHLLNDASIQWCLYSTMPYVILRVQLIQGSCHPFIKPACAQCDRASALFPFMHSARLAFASLVQTRSDVQTIRVHGSLLTVRNPCSPLESHTSQDHISARLPSYSAKPVLTFGVAHKPRPYKCTALFLQCKTAEYSQKYSSSWRRVQPNVS